MASQDRIVLRNEFNNESFIFTPGDDPEVARFDVILGIGGSGGGNALVHIHPGASETFTVKSGRLAVVMRGIEHVLEVGQSFTIPAGTPHYFKNAGAEATEALVEFHPAQQHLRFFRNFAMLAAKRTEWFSTKGDPHLLLIALVLHAYRGHLYLAGIPIFVQKMLFGALAPVARYRGYRLEIEPLARKAQS
ncbi:MAG: cupin domain-containing protein [Chitinophagales bacterium]|nr:cupin domain-containing protein [Hyphomicrobiales bacterium]